MTNAQRNKRYRNSQVGRGPMALPVIPARCPGCHREWERTARGWRKIRLVNGEGERTARGWRKIRLVNGECGACRESAAEAQADDDARRAAQ
jgi:hypothetical protein